MNTEQLQTIGPWGFLFAFVAAILAVALAKLLMSDPQRTISRMKGELEEARKAMEASRRVIQDLNGQVMKWTNHAEDQARTIEAQNRDIKDLQHTRDALKEAVRLKDETIQMQKEMIERGEKYQKEQQEKIEWLVGRVVQMDAAKGISTKLPWSE